MLNWNSVCKVLLQSTNSLSTKVAKFLHCN